MAISPKAPTEVVATDLPPVAAELLRGRIETVPWHVAHGAGDPD